MHSSQLLFSNADFFNKFKQDIHEYCKSQGYVITLSDAEITHLSWSVGNAYASPEAGKNIHPDFPHLPFEIKRSLARCYSLELLCRGGENDYHQFVCAQADNAKLSKSDFITLSAEMKNIDKETRAVIRATCFLILTPELRNICGVSMSADSEEFLTDLAALVAVNPGLTPITKGFNAKQAALLTVTYWPNLHMRWLYSTEGGENMTRSLVNAIGEGKLKSADELTVWVWRWRLNIAGFQGGPSAKFYDRTSHQLIEAMLVELKKLFINPDVSFIEQYLESNFRAANLPGEKLAPAERVWLGHLVTYFAYFHRLDIFKAENAAAMMSAYLDFKEEFPDLQGLAMNYLAACRNEDAVTPTYIPGIMDTALGLFKSHLDAKGSGVESLPEKVDCVALFKEHSENDVTAIALTVRFMCQLVAPMYQTLLNARVSGFQMAQVKNLKVVIEAWLRDRQSVQFKLTDNMEITFDVKPVECKLSPSHFN